jgi:K+-transporting ATPase KdpF subunit
MNYLRLQKYIMPWTKSEVDCVKPYILFPCNHPFPCGLGVSRIDPAVAPRQLGVDRRLRPADGGHKMNALYIIAGVITLALLVYLILALLKPEWFG